MPQPPEFSLTGGGPFDRWMQRLRLKRPDGRVRGERLALFAWVPFILGEAARSAMGGQPDGLLEDLSVHARLLIALPVMLLAGWLVDAASKSGIKSLYQGAFADPSELDAVVRLGERLRDSPWPERLCGVVALGVGQLALWRITGPAGMIHGGAEGVPWSFARVWYSLVALPLALFVMYRWLWLWGVWAFMLAKLARLPLTGLATHPDLAAGLACVSRPLSGYAGFVFALGSVVAGAWGTQLLAGRTTVKAEMPMVLGFLILMLCIAVLPLLPFSVHVYNARRSALAKYGDFANDYVRVFHQKWVTSSIGGASALGSADIQSLSDLGNSFSVILKTRFFVFGWRPVIMICVAALLPMLPILASTVTVEDVLKRIVSAVFGGFPI